jgi:2OG-Fe(II) oxygenase superfamily
VLPGCTRATSRVTDICHDEPVETFDDLQQVLGYRGAFDATADDSLIEVGAEVYRTSFWKPEFCATIIRAAEAVGAFEVQDDDPVPGHEVSLAMISPVLFERVQQDLGARIWPRLRRVWPYIDYYGLRDAFVIRYAIGEQESLRIHHDVAQVSGSVKLNSDYRGGELDFPRQAITNADVTVGDLLAWPSLVTHPHQTKQLHSGVKYALTIWFELPQI